VFVVRGAEELGTSAANALLKMLEEPLPRTHFVLVSDRPERVLSTLRSRTLSVRFGPLGDSVLEKLLGARGVSPEEASQLAELAEGSMARAFALRDAESQDAESAFVDSVEGAVREPGAAGVMALSDSVKGHRDVLERNLRALSRHFAKGARAAVSAGTDPERQAIRYGIAREALTKLTRNAAPPLVVEALVFALRRA
jgi:DNA polymerase-3 subunit delta'